MPAICSAIAVAGPAIPPPMIIALRTEVTAGSFPRRERGAWNWAHAGLRFGTGHASFNPKYSEPSIQCQVVEPSAARLVTTRPAAGRNRKNPPVRAHADGRAVRLHNRRRASGRRPLDLPSLRVVGRVTG